jgi:molybdopterin/thiamine biosynthesis adenylyltransferase
MNYVIGAGGIASWLVPALCKLVGCTEVTVIDKDTVEFRNLDRQFFDVPDIGKSKAMALAEKYSCNYIAGEWYTCGCLDHDYEDVLLVCADNHPARREAIQAADLYGIECIIAANERTSSEAYYYGAAWQGTNLDPRVYYPEILDDHTGDPRLAAIGCTGAAQVATPQLVSANLMAASLALHLYNVWIIEYEKFEENTIPHLPYLLRMNLTKSETFKAATIKERIEHEATSTDG